MFITFVQNCAIQELIIINLVDEIQKDIFRFVWKGNNDSISRKTSSKSIIDGGIGIPDICIYMNALKITLIRKLIQTNHNWKYILLQSNPIIDKIQEIGVDIPLINLNKFWYDVFKAYQDLNNVTVVIEPNDFLAEPISYL